MKKITKVTLFIAAVSAVVLITVAFWPVGGWTAGPETVKGSSVPKFSLPLFSRKNTANAMITLSPNEKNLSQGERLRIKVLVESKANLVGGDLVFQFDPTLLSFEEVRIGDFFKEAKEIKEIVDQEQGIISYSLGSFLPKSGSGTLIELSFLAKKNGLARVSLTGQTELAAVKIDEVKTSLPVLGQYTIY